MSVIVICRVQSSTWPIENPLYISHGWLNFLKGFIPKVLSVHKHVNSFHDR